MVTLIVKLNGWGGFCMALRSILMFTLYGSVLKPAGDMVASIPSGRPSITIGPREICVVKGTRVILNRT